MHVSLPPYEAAALADHAEALAWADFVAAASDSLRTQLGLRVEHIADATLLIAPGTSMTFFNRAIGLGMRKEANTEDVDLIVERYRRAGSSEWRLLWSPLARPEQMASILAARGFAYPAVSSWVKMRRGTETPLHIASELAVVEASENQAEEVARIVVNAFEMPLFMVEWLAQIRGRTGWKMYAVTDRTEVVGGGCLFLSGDLAWLGWTAIAAPHRCRGSQSVLIARRVENAIASGARHIFSETGEPSGDKSNPSLNNLMRCGFSKVASRHNIAGPSPARINAILTPTFL
jgi:hypothetical protein